MFHQENWKNMPMCTYLTGVIFLATAQWSINWARFNISAGWPCSFFFAAHLSCCAASFRWKKGSSTFFYFMTKLSSNTDCDGPSWPPSLFLACISSMHRTSQHLSSTLPAASSVLHHPTNSLTRHLLNIVSAKENLALETKTWAEKEKHWHWHT